MTTPTLEKLAALEQKGSSDGKGMDPNRNKRGPIAAVLAAIGIALTKMKGVLFLVLSKFKFLLVAIKLLKFSKYALTLTSMFASMWLYGLRFGYLFGVGLVLLIFIHELGHGYAAKKLGLNVGMPIFIPFFGAVIALREAPKTPWINAVVGAGGPVFGTIAGIFVTAVALSGSVPQPYDSLLIALAYFNFTINFFNLLPVFGLDGDRISAPLFPYQLYILALLVGISGYFVSHWTGYVETALPFVTFFLFWKGVRLQWSAHRPTRSTLEKLENIETTPGIDLVTHNQRHIAGFVFGVLAIGLTFLSAELHYLLQMQLIKG